jgi:hypothetical protein
MLLAHEIDLEISFRQRLAETIKSRIDWALILQESLANGRYSTFSPLPYSSLGLRDEQKSAMTKL